MLAQVWAIGIVIYCLVHRIEQPESIIYTRDTPLELLEPEALPLGPISVSMANAAHIYDSDLSSTEAGLLGHTDHSHARLSPFQPR